MPAAKEKVYPCRTLGGGHFTPVSALRAEARRKAARRGTPRRLDGLDRERQAIAADQQRLRENMKALRGSDEERQLLRRYTTQLSEQEDRLAALQRELAQQTAARDKAQQELSALVDALSFEFTAQAAAGR